MSDRKSLETKNGELESKAVGALVDFLKAKAELEWIEYLEDNNFPEETEKNEWTALLVSGWIEDKEFLSEIVETATQLAFDEMTKKAV